MHAYTHGHAITNTLDDDTHVDTCSWAYTYACVMYSLTNCIDTLITITRKKAEEVLCKSKPLRHTHDCMHAYACVTVYAVTHALASKHAYYRAFVCIINLGIFSFLFLFFI